MAPTKKGMLADLFDATFRTLSRTWTTSLVCGGVLFIPPALLSGWAFETFFDAVGTLALFEDMTSGLLSLGLAYAWLLLAAVLQGFAILFVRACVTEHTARVVRGESAGVLGLAGWVLGRRYGRLIGQRALQYAILGVTITVATVAGGVAVGIGQVADLPLVSGLGVTIFVLAGGALIVWLSVRWSLTLEAVVIEGSKIEPSFGRSEALVRGAWWRVFGYTLLLGLMVSFAISLIATPIVFFSSIGAYARFLGDLVSGSEEAYDMTGMMLSLFEGMGIRMAVLTYIQSLFAALVTPVFMSLLFFELRKRTDTPGLIGEPGTP